MSHLLAGLWRLLQRHVLLLILIVMLLAAGKWVAEQWRQGQALIGQLPALHAAQRDVAALQAALGRDLSAQGARLAGASLARLDASIAALDGEIVALQRQQAPVSVARALSGIALPQQLQQQARLGVALSLRRQLRAYLVEARLHALAASNRQAAHARLEQLRLAHVQVHAQLLHTQRELARLRGAAGWFAAVPGTSAHRQARTWQRQLAQLTAANGQAYQAYRAQQAVLARLALPGPLAAFQIKPAQHAAVALLQERLAHAESLAAHNLVWRAYQAARPVLPLALGILAVWVLLPVLLRTLFYFVLAPLAARRPPLVIAPGMPWQPASGGRSAVSLMVTLQAGDELLCRPQYCQSQPHGVVARTALLADWRHAFTCMAAQLWMLTRLRSRHRCQVVLSATHDPLDELAILQLDSGAAMVLQPRALVGMVHAQGGRARIRSHWRLGSLHAWLTLQLRYLVFEGPAQLVVRGCRGVRLENAKGGRIISQEATLGFSAHARYGTLRSEPFLAYLRGLQPLYHDRFDGDHAFFLYEEVPRRRGKHAPPANPLSLFVEAGLKAFGI